MPSSEAEVISIHRELYMQREHDPRDPRLVPQSIIDSIKRYLDHRISPGSFVQAVLSNDLVDACARADRDNLQVLVAITTYVYHEVPSLRWGSREIVNAWIAGEEP